MVNDGCYDGTERCSVKRYAIFPSDSGTGAGTSETAAKRETVFAGREIEIDRRCHCRYIADVDGGGRIVNVKVGDVVVRKLDFTFAPDNGNAGREARNHTGRVVYVHPKGRFFVVEFPMRNKATIRVSFRSEGN